MKNTLDLIAELNDLSPYGIYITNNKWSGDFNTPVKETKNIKVDQWKVTSYFNPNITDISYTVCNKNLDLALQIVIDWLKENL